MPVLSTSNWTEWSVKYIQFIGLMRDIGVGTFTQLRLEVDTSATSTIVKVESSSMLIFEGLVTQDNPAVIDIPVELLVSGYDYIQRQKGLRVYTTDD